MLAAHPKERGPFGILILLALLPLMRLEGTAMASDQIDDRTARRDAASRAVFAASPRRDAIEFVDQWKDDWNVARVNLITPISAMLFRRSSPIWGASRA